MQRRLSDPFAHALRAHLLTLNAHLRKPICESPSAKAHLRLPRRVPPRWLLCHCLQAATEEVEQAQAALERVKTASKEERARLVKTCIETLTSLRSHLIKTLGQGGTVDESQPVALDTLSMRKADPRKPTTPRAPLKPSSSLPALGRGFGSELVVRRAQRHDASEKTVPTQHHSPPEHRSPPKASASLPDIQPAHGAAPAASCR